MMAYSLKYILFSFLLIVGFLPLVSDAQVVDSFTVSQLIGLDSTAPTIPAPVTATPIAATQIDVTWGASTDDQSLLGYRLFRDAVQIATTSLLAYSDTGLTASTTYTYTVEAYDWVFNISTTSAPAATTTLALPVVTPVATSTNSTGSKLSPRLISLEVDPKEESAHFSWGTNIYTKYVLRWGSSSEYDLGFIRNDVYSRMHTTTIQGLDADTQYLFELVGVNQLGREFILKQGTFTTQAKKDDIAPANVSNVQTITENDSVYIQWVNPADGDFEKVRVVRNYLFYPSDPLDGFIVYEGPAQTVYDAGALSTYPDQYYTIFAYDTTGNISSGAITFARRSGLDTGAATADTNDVPDKGTLMTDAGLTFLDVRFIQENNVVPHTNGQVVIDSVLPLEIQISSELLSRNLKTIVVTFTDVHDDTQSYMLRSNNDKTAYQALLRSLPEGTYNVLFSIFDYHTQLHTTFDGQIVSQKWVSSNDVHGDTQQVTSVSSYSLRTEYGLVVGSLGLLLLILWFLLAKRRSREDN